MLIIIIIIQQKLSTTIPKIKTKEKFHRLFYVVVKCGLSWNNTNWNWFENKVFSKTY